MKKAISLLLLSLFTVTLISCGCKDCKMCDGTGKYTANGPHKGMKCTSCGGDGCRSK
jgi:hypothetical protein